MTDRRRPVRLTAAAAAICTTVTVGPRPRRASPDVRAVSGQHSETEDRRNTRERFTRDERQRRLELIAELLGPLPPNRAARRDRDRRVRHRTTRP